MWQVPGLAAYVLCVAGLLGLVMGSFLNCLAWRVVHGGSVLRGRSHCPDCGHVLAARDLVPVISWLAAGRKCRYCARPVSARYPATELACAALYVSIAAAYGLSLETLELLGFASALFVAVLTDLDDFLIPNGCIVAALAIRLAYLVADGLGSGGDWLAAVGWSLFAGAVMFAALHAIVYAADKLLGTESMGYGDVKLYAVAACYFGLALSLFLVLLSCVFGLAAGLVSARSAAEADGAPPDETHPLRKPFPFGPSIALACWVTMLAGPSFLGWYLAFLG